MVVTKPRHAALFAAYALVVVIGFILMGRYLAVVPHPNELLKIIAVVGAPGILIAVFFVGVHSDSFTSAIVISNIVIYLLVPCLLWAWRARKRRTSATPESRPPR
jgi:hypothetical protein